MQATEMGNPAQPRVTFDTIPNEVLAPPAAGIHSQAMHHPSARRAISCILAGPGFDERAVALVLASGLDAIPGASEALKERALVRCEAMAADIGLGYTGPLRDEVVAEDGRSLFHQLSPIISAHPAQTGMQLACVDALRVLWPHVANHERNGMRTRFLATACTRTAPAASGVTLAELEAWQRDLPTSAGIDDEPSIAGLQALLNENDPRRAYLVIADHLGCSFKPAQLAGVLGALAVQLLVTLRDREGWISQVLLGCQAIEHVADIARPERLATLLSQLAHQLWWCRQRARLQPVRVCLDSSVPPLIEALRSGDLSAAQRSARLASVQPERYWKHILALLEDTLDFNDRGWARSLRAVSTVAQRSRGALPPDDAAALASVLADQVYQRQSTPAVR